MNVRGLSPTPRRPTASTARIVAAAAAAGLAFTLLVSVTDVVHFAYRSTVLHVAVETAAAGASIVAAQSIYGRFRASLQLRDLLVTAALCVYACSNLLLAVVPDVAGGEDGGFRTWARVLAHLVATAVLATAAFTPETTVRRPRAAVRWTLGACAAAIGLIAAGTAVAGDVLPVAVPASAAPSGPHIVGDPVVLGAQLLSMTLFWAAAVGFGLRAARTHDQLLGWIAVAATFGGFARLNYFLFPSLYTEWFYAGDGLRLASFLALFAGGVQETRRLQHQLAAAAVLEERRRIARELHDGVTQDLAYIVQQLRHVADVAGGHVDHLVPAAERALDESRHAIAALVRPGGGPLGEAIAATAREVAGREGVDVSVDVVPDVVVPARTQQEILRVVREALLNAARHGDVSRVGVQLREQPRLSVSIVDDGSGFDPSAPRLDGHLGLDAMAERVRAIGGELAIESAPGRGTEVRVTLP
jgi:signal transduction histidine kinase